MSYPHHPQDLWDFFLPVCEWQPHRYIFATTIVHKCLKSDFSKRCRNIQFGKLIVSKCLTSYCYKGLRKSNIAQLIVGKCQIFSLSLLPSAGCVNAHFLKAAFIIVFTDAGSSICPHSHIKRNMPDRYIPILHSIPRLLHSTS